MPVWLLVLLVCAATHRVTRLVTRDEFPPVARPRRWLVKRWPEGSFTYLMHCAWCSSVWVGGIIVAVIAWQVGLPAPVLVWGAASSVTGLLAQLEPDE